MQFEGLCNGILNGNQLHQHQAKAPIDDLLKSVAQLKIKEDMDISFNSTIRKGKCKSKDDGKGKHKE